MRGLVAALLLAALPVRAQSQLPFASLEVWVSDFKARLPGAGSEAFVAPSLAEQTAFADCFTLLLSPHPADAMPCLDALGYDLGLLVDGAASSAWWVAEEKPANVRGLGAFVVTPYWPRDTLLVAPHPLFDTNTPEESARLFLELDARALVIAGTHRCANAALTPCDGTTTACGPSGPYHVSDAAHFDQTLIQAAHQAALRLASVPRAWSLHGNSSEPVDVTLCDGTLGPAAATTDVIRLRDALLVNGVPAGSCNWPPDTGLALCGTTNVAGRLYNGSGDPCQTPAAAASGRFLHLEQRRNVRDDPTALIAAAKETFPPDRLLLLAVRSGADVVLRFARTAGALTITRDRAPDFALAPTTALGTGPLWTDAGPPAGNLYYKVE